METALNNQNTPPDGVFLPKRISIWFAANLTCPYSYILADITLCSHGIEAITNYCGRLPFPPQQSIKEGRAAAPEVIRMEASFFV